MSGSVTCRLRAAVLLVCIGTALQLSLAAPKPHKQAPLRFDLPAAGITQASNPGYDACIDNPSPDGLPIDCQALRQPATASDAKLRRR